MSRNDWEQGTIKLPSAEFAKVRQAVADADMKTKAELFEHSQAFWKSLTTKQKTDYPSYVAAFNEWEKKHTVTRRSGFGSWGSTYEESTLPDGLQELVRAYGGWYGNQAGQKPARVLKENMDFPTNRTTAFRTGYGDGGIHFDKSTNSVEWVVNENNHAVEHAHASPLAQSFFDAIKNVRWTRNTGGYFTGNDEYNQDNREAGGGQNYVTSGFGPIGADFEPYHTADYRTAEGKLVRRDDFPAVKKARADIEKARQKERTAAAAKQRRQAAAAQAKREAASGQQGRIGAGSAAGGQFAAKGQSRPEINL